MQPEKVRLVRQWIIKANRDSLAVKHLMDGTPPLYDAAVYHCQQAAEKALKGYLTWHDRPFQRTHDLLELVQLSADVDIALQELRGAAVILTPYATQFRYPAETLEPDPGEVVEAIRLAQQVLDLVRERLPSNVKEGDTF